MAEKSLKSTVPRTAAQAAPKPQEASAPKEKAPEKPEPKKTAVKAPPKAEDGVRVYIGPAIRGLIQYGTVYPSAHEAKERLGEALKIWPQLTGLLVSLEDLPRARVEVKKPGTAWYVMAEQIRDTLSKP